MKEITIRDIRTIYTAPRNINLIVIKIETSEPGLYGVGCATFTQRYSAIGPAVDNFLKPLLVGRSVHDIEDIWQQAYNSSYWRNGPVLNNALSGVDEALWDIKGKIAGMPLYQLFGGRSRTGALVYRHAEGKTKEEVAANVQKLVDQGCQVVRIQQGSYGGNQGGANQTIISPKESFPGAYYDPELYIETVVELVRYIREKFGPKLGLAHDIHERLEPVWALRLAKELEPYNLFFLEDALSPDQIQWFEYLRKQTCVPLAMGELFNNPLEWRDIISKNYIDYIRVHISQIGGLTPALKLAHFCEAYRVRTAWHGPGDLSPIGAAAQLHLDLHSNNFGIQEFAGFSETEKIVFPGCPKFENGYLYVNDKPGIGVDIDEEAAKEYPCVYNPHNWTKTRYPDGTAVHP